jgi:hypothetical protein
MLGIMLSGIKKRKAEPRRCVCQTTGEPLSEQDGYIITTSQLIASKKFWDMRMTDSDTLSYTLQHFRDRDQSATSIRRRVFEKYASEPGFLIVSSKVIGLFDVDQSRARKLAQVWWKVAQCDFLDQFGHEIQPLTVDEFEKYRAYAIIYAGKIYAQSLR